MAEPGPVRHTTSGDLALWRDAIVSAYYQQDVSAEAASPFAGAMSILELGDLSLSRIHSPPVTYRRHRTQISPRSESHHLITVPLAGDLFFEQAGVQSRCAPRSLLAERGDVPYELHQPDRNELLVLKVPDSALTALLPPGKRLRGTTLGPSLGIAGLFIDLMQSAITHADTIQPAHYPIVRRQILEILVLALTAGDTVLESEQSSVRSAHLRRIRSVIRTLLYEPDLSPGLVAAESGISVRYLHKLFASTGTTVNRWILEQRLQAADDALRNPRRRGSIAQIAQDFGFTDQPQFCRHYRRQFGRTPRDTRALAGHAAGSRG